MDVILPYLAALTAFIPRLLVSIVGLIIAIFRRQRHPKVSLLMVIVIALDILLSLTSPLISTVVIRSGVGASQVGSILAVWGLFAGLLSAINSGLLLWAVFGWRTPPPQPSY